MARLLVVAGVASGVGKTTVTLGVLEAFQFYYEENLDLLRAAGAEIVAWSPLHDRGLPDVDGLYLGGGYPELHGAALAANEAMRRDVLALARSGRPIYAECGGLMYLAEALEDLAGERHPMVGLLPTTVHMVPGRLTLGYTEVVLTEAALLGGAGTVVRRHEFHLSTMDAVPPGVPRVYRLQPPGGLPRAEGYRVGASLLSYVHLHFASNPEVARAFVGACGTALKDRSPG